MSSADINPKLFTTHWPDYGHSMMACALGHSARLCSSIRVSRRLTRAHLSFFVSYAGVAILPPSKRSSEDPANIMQSRHFFTLKRYLTNSLKLSEAFLIYDYDM